MSAVNLCHLLTRNRRYYCLHQKYNIL